ncbi:Fructose-bisphosphate aldolase [Mycena sanguinolenta]|uniref:(2E,6E)-farnesyl diphosphate synthase n=1 Tax=Mycena sanguinolenta TaxID=230812 RepID=A0A8H7D126_9AGAR|nr:Fructose-bisphosphate aldolase [Mycena sanguinolenta]
MTDKAAKRARFEAAWPHIRDELIAYLSTLGMPAEAIEWYRENLNYNVPGGKLNRGMAVVDTAEILKGVALDDDEYSKAAVLGWSAELLQALFLVTDDIMDTAITRRGQPCWYRAPGIGMKAINDAMMLESGIFFLLKKHFRNQPYYVDLLELFQDTAYRTGMGQLIDLITAPQDEVNLSKFSLDRYRLIVISKTAYYSFYLPVALAMHISGVPASYMLGDQTVEPYKVALSILLPLGEYCQIQDDFLDLVAPPECSWCVNTALALATPEQRSVLDENYGRKDAAAEARVKEVFEAVGLREHYAKYEADVYQRLVEMIAGISEGGELTLKREIFTSFLDKIHKRTM